MWRGDPRRVDAGHEWSGSASLPQADLSSDEGYLYDRPRRPVRSANRPRSGSVRLPGQAVRGRSAGATDSGRLGKVVRPSEADWDAVPDLAYIYRYSGERRLSTGRF